MNTAVRSYRTLSLCLLVLLGMVVLLQGCAVSLDSYKDNTPRLEMTRFFSGQLKATGVVEDYRGKVIRRFSADINGYWQGNQGVLDERFYFADGEVQNRCWQLKKEGDVFTGTAADVVGEARGRVAGNTLHWRYVLRVPVGDSEWQLALDDWLYLVDENNLINRTRMSKLGLGVGEITLHIRRVSDQPQPFADETCQLVAEGL
ncbi:DUF3833 domain-containing protein [Aliamphritea spongicola]|uniref:DUF3833 domain-containing protein n=1 Tax=Aliamphritea spongicola TaxID=707589 RepID=UPI00196B6261|nr:DUF3833 domain-containing protein [Aliamphritea spongicola]MBN3564356.1 DUF3833 domain-containing protein [Aliamphritea spongicola]